MGKQRKRRGGGKERYVKGGDKREGERERERKKKPNNTLVWMVAIIANLTHSPANSLGIHAR